MTIVTSFNARVGAVVSQLGDYVASTVGNDSTVTGATVKAALETLKAAIAAIPAAPVSSVFGRVGAVVAAANDYLASQVNNDSTVTGATVAAALNTLKAAIAAIPAAPVSSVFGRVGAVVAVLNDYLASQVNNDSTVTGATVAAALNTLKAAIAAIPAAPVSSVFGRVGAVVAVLNDYAASLVQNDSSVTGATVKDALNALQGYKWVVATSAARLALTVTAAQVGARAKQTDINQVFELVSVSPSKWTEVPNGDVTTMRAIVATTSGTAFMNTGLVASAGLLNGSVGTILARAPTTGSRGVAAIRAGMVTPASITQNLIIRSQSVPAGAQGLRMKQQWVPQAITTNLRWCAGVVTTGGPFNSALSSALNCAFVGREPSIDTNIQFYFNDGTGVASKVDLGAAFPGSPVVGHLYELEIFIPAGAASLSFRFQDLDAGTETSGTIATDIPTFTSASSALELYWDNTIDATAVGVDWVYGGLGQLAVS